MRQGTQLYSIREDETRFPGRVDISYTVWNTSRKIFCSIYNGGLDSSVDAMYIVAIKILIVYVILNWANK